jgi:hypothetical protein
LRITLTVCGRGGSVPQYDTGIPSPSAVPPPRVKEKLSSSSASVDEDVTVEAILLLVDGVATPLVGRGVTTLFILVGDGNNDVVDVGDAIVDDAVDGDEAGTLDDSEVGDDAGDDNDIGVEAGAGLDG